jgi:calcineurin-like phosphoesterase family protein
MARQQKQFFTSDTHFGHAMVADLRGFRDGDSPGSFVRNHDEEIIERWNCVVQPDDLVFHLGDVGLGGDEDYIFECVHRLNGHKQLILGNHDKPWAARRNGWKHMGRWMEKSGFESIQSYAAVGIGLEGMADVVLSHFPYEGDHTDLDRYTQWRLPDEGRVLVHGHLHTKDKVTAARSIHVGLDAWDLRPAPAFALRHLIVNHITAGA